MTALLTVSVASSGYGRVQVLHDVEVAVGDGEIVAVLGANGAGKSTLLRTISGVLVTAVASVSLGGRELGGVAAARRAAAGLVHVPEGRRVFAGLTVTENLVVPAHARRVGADELQRRLDRVIELFPVLGERAGQRAGSLSGGQQQMLAIGRGLMGQPRVLMIDEASLGLAPTVIEALFDVIARLRDDGLAILLVEQNVRSSLEIADRAYVLERGTVALAGPAADLVRDERVQATYLGGALETQGGT